MAQLMVVWDGGGGVSTGKAGQAVNLQPLSVQSGLNSDFSILFCDCYLCVSGGKHD